LSAGGASDALPADAQKGSKAPLSSRHQELCREVRARVLRAWGDHLIKKGLYSDAALVLASGAYLPGALSAYRLGGLWRLALAVARRWAWATEKCAGLLGRSAGARGHREEGGGCRAGNRVTRAKWRLGWSCSLRPSTGKKPSLAACARGGRNWCKAPLSLRPSTGAAKPGESVAQLSVSVL